MYFIKQLCRYGAYLASTILETWQFPTHSSTETSKTSAAPSREWPTDCHNQQPSDRRYSDVRRTVKTRHSVSMSSDTVRNINFMTWDNGGSPHS